MRRPSENHGERGSALLVAMLMLALMGIIAIAYPNPEHPTVWMNALWILPGMAIALQVSIR